MEDFKLLKIKPFFQPAAAAGAVVAAAAAAAAAQCIEVLRLQVRPLGGVWWRGEETTAPHCHNATTQPSNLTARILNTSAIREGILSFSPIASL